MPERSGETAHPVSFGRTLKPLDEVDGWLREQLPEAAAERVPTARAQGRRAMEAVTAAEDHPKRTSASRDGFALRAELSVGASLYAPVVLSLGIDGGARPIALGDRLPEDCDSVVEADTVRTDGASVQLSTAVHPGAGTMPAGGELASGTPLVEAGMTLSALDCARLAACGVAGLAVRSEVRVGLLRCGAYAGPDVTGPLLAAELRRSGASPVWIDSPAVIHEDRNGGLTLLLLYGGSGWSAADDAEQVLGALGECHWHGCAVNPGASLLGGMAGTVPAVGLPGSPWPAFAAYRLAVSPALAAFRGTACDPPRSRARLARKVTSALGLTEYVPVRVDDGLAQPLRRGGLLPPAGMSGAVRVADGSEGFPREAQVAVEPV